MSNDVKIFGWPQSADRIRSCTGVQGSTDRIREFRGPGLIPGLFQAFRAYSGLIPGLPGLSRASSRASGLIPRAAAIPSLSFLSGESHVFFFVNEVCFWYLGVVEFREFGEFLSFWSYGSFGSFGSCLGVLGAGSAGAQKQKAQEVEAKQALALNPKP